MDHFAGQWILNEFGVAVKEPDLIKWAAWMHNSDSRIIARTEIHHCTVSTVFLGIDYNFSSSGLPLLFETMVFQGEKESMDCASPVWFEGAEDHIGSLIWGDLRRYSFKGDAVQGHHEAVRSIEQQFGETQEKVSGLIYGIMNSEEWVKDGKD